MFGVDTKSFEAKGSHLWIFSVLILFFQLNRTAVLLSLLKLVFGPKLFLNTKTVFSRNFHLVKGYPPAFIADFGLRKGRFRHENSFFSIMRLLQKNHNVLTVLHWLSGEIHEPYH